MPYAGPPKGCASFPGCPSVRHRARHRASAPLVAWTSTVGMGARSVIFGFWLGLGPGKTRSWTPIQGVFHPPKRGFGPPRGGPDVHLVVHQPASQPSIGCTTPSHPATRRDAEWKRCPRLWPGIQDLVRKWWFWHPKMGHFDRFGHLWRVQGRFTGVFEPFWSKNRGF